MKSPLEAAIDAAWELRSEIGPESTGPVRDAVNEVLELLDSGKLRVAEPVDGDWRVNQWLKKAVLLSFRLSPTLPVEGDRGPVPGTIRSRRSLSAGAPSGLRRRGFAPSPAAMSAAPPTSRPAWY